MLKDERILITGGAGSIGSELVRQLHENNAVYVIDNNETAFFDLVEELGLRGKLADVRNKESIKSIWKEFAPSYIFHVAALKHVTPSMQTPMEYVETNIRGTNNLLEVNQECWRAKFINVSTDKAARCDNVMGWSKRGTELLTKIHGGISVRFGNVLGSRGSVIPIWQKQIDEGRPVTVTDERMTRFMMTIEEAAGLVIEAAQTGQPGDIMILDLDKRKINVLDLAKKVIEESGTDVPIKIIGARPGEVLSEELMNEHEQKSCIKEGKFYILREGTRSQVLEGQKAN